MLSIPLRRPVLLLKSVYENPSNQDLFFSHMYRSCGLIMPCLELCHADADRILFRLSVKWLACFVSTIIRLEDSVLPGKNPFHIQNALTFVHVYSKEKRNRNMR